MGKYLLLASAVDLAGVEINEFALVGKSLEEWNNEKLSSWGQIPVQLNKVSNTKNTPNLNLLRKNTRLEIPRNFCFLILSRMPWGS